MLSYSTSSVRWKSRQSSHLRKIYIDMLYTREMCHKGELTSYSLRFSSFDERGECGPSSVGLFGNSKGMTRIP